MSRRRQKAWEDLLARHRWAADTEDMWRGVALELGMSLEDFYRPDYASASEGAIELDVEEIRAAARKMFFDRQEGAPPPLVMMTLKCQRCDRRIDTWRVRAKRWVAPRPDADERWRLEGLEWTSEQWAKQIGDSADQLFRHFAGKPVRFDCPCGRQDIQFSTNRIAQTLNDLAPTMPTWAGWGDDAQIVWPPTRYVSICG